MEFLTAGWGSALAPRTDGGRMKPAVEMLAQWTAAASISSLAWTSVRGRSKGGGRIRGIPTGPVWIDAFEKLRFRSGLLVVQVRTSCGYHGDDSAWIRCS